MSKIEKELDKSFNKYKKKQREEYLEDRKEDVRSCNGRISIDLEKINNGEKGTTIFKDDVITMVLRNIENAGFDRNKARKLTGFCVSLAIGTDIGEAYLRCLSTPGKDDFTKDPVKYGNAYLAKYPILAEMTSKLTVAFQRKIAEEAVKGYAATSGEVLTNLRNLLEIAMEEGNLTAAIKINELLGKQAGLWRAKEVEQNIIIQSNIPSRSKKEAIEVLKEEDIVLPDINPHLVRR